MRTSKELIREIERDVRIMIEKEVFDSIRAGDLNGLPYRIRDNTSSIIACLTAGYVDSFKIERHYNQSDQMESVSVRFDPLLIN
jgi:hypothetical protein